MRCFKLLVALPIPWVAAFSINAYDLGLHGLYPRQHFHSSDFEPPVLKTTRWDSRCDSGKLFFTPRGPMVNGPARGPVILDPKGNLIWMGSHDFEQAMNLNVQKYKGQDYLTFWTKTSRSGQKKKGHKKNGHKKNGDKKNTSQNKSSKSYLMLNSSYEVAYRITPHGKGLKGDSHEFRITPQGTALITIYYKHQVDCTLKGMGKSCWIQDGIFQEIDIETGKLIFEWRATDHISMRDVYSSPNRKDGYGKSKHDAFDFFHINSVDKIDSGDYIISARYMHAIVCISGKTGEILWQVGGKHSSFKGLDGALNFAWQHHVTWQGNNTISLFDNHANTVLHSPSKHSKGMIIKLNMEEMTATLLGSYVHPDKILNVSQGSVQVVPETGNVLVGFGNSPTYVEYSPDGKALCSTHFAPHLLFELVDFGFVKSYRIFKSPWVGKPKSLPDIKARNGKLYVSWNGATEVTSWRLELAASSAAKDGKFIVVQELARDGFETSFTLDNVKGHVRIVALDAARSIMASSAVVKVDPPTSLLFSFVVVILASSIIGLAIFIFLRQQFTHIRRLPRLSSFSKIRTRFSNIKKNDQGPENESSPLLPLDGW